MLSIGAQNNVKDGANDSHWSMGKYSQTLYRPSSPSLNDTETSLIPRPPSISLSLKGHESLGEAQPEMKVATRRVSTDVGDV